MAKKMKLLIDLDVEYEEYDEDLIDDIYNNIVKSGRGEGLRYRIVDGCVADNVLPDEE